MSGAPITVPKIGFPTICRCGRGAEPLAWITLGLGGISLQASLSADGTIKLYGGTKLGDELMHAVEHAAQQAVLAELERRFAERPEQRECQP